MASSAARMLNSGCGSTSSASLREAVVRSIDGLQHGDLARLRRHSLYQFEQLRDRVLVLHRHAGEVAGGSRNASGQARCEAPLNFRGIPMTQPPGDFMKTRGRGQSDRRPVHPVVIPRSKCEAAQPEIKSPAEAGQKGRRVGRPAAGPTLCLRAGPALAARRSKSARRERRQPSGLLREPLSA